MIRHTLKTFALAGAALAVLAGGALAQPKPSGTPDRPVSTGTNTTREGSPSMSPSNTTEPGNTGSAGNLSEPPGSRTAPGRTNGRQDTPSR